MSYLKCINATECVVAMILCVIGHAAQGCQMLSSRFPCERIIGTDYDVVDGYEFSWLAAVDIDNDTDTDVVGYIGGTHFLRFFENIDAGAGWRTFLTGASTRLPSGKITSVAMGDVDGDGLTDFVAAGSDLLAWFQHNGGFSYTYHDIYPIGATSVVVADLDNDGHTDIVAAVPNSTTGLHLHRGRGDGLFDTPTPIYSSNKDCTSTIYALQANEDELLDLFVSCPSQAELLLQDGAMNFGEPISIYGRHTSPDVVISSLDSSTSTNPLVLERGTNGGNLVYHRDIGANGTSWAEVIVDRNIGYGKVVVAADLDRDGDQDIIVAQDILAGRGPLLSWYENIAPNGHFSDKYEIHTERSRSGSEAIAVGDINGDGWDDIVFVRYTENDSIDTRYHEVVWYENGGY